MTQEKVYTDAMLQPERLIALAIIKNHFIKTLRETEEFCIYTNGVFDKGNGASTRIKNWISEEIEGLFYYDQSAHKRMYRLTPSKLNTILYFIRDFTYVSSREFDANENVVNLRNCLFSLDGFDGMAENPAFDSNKPEGKDNSRWIRARVPTKYHDSDPNDHTYLSFVQFPITYDSQAKCPNIEKFLEEVNSWTH